MENTFKVGLDRKRFKYVNQLVIQPRLKENDALRGLIEETARHPQEIFASTADQLLLYQSLAYMLNAKKVLDCGTFTGLSSLAFAQGCADDGHVYTIDVEEKFVNIGREYWKKAGVENKITSILRPAEEVVAEMRPQHEGTFDIIFLDVPKNFYIPVYEHLVPLLRPRGLLLVDNIFFQKKVLEENCGDSPEASFVKKFNQGLSEDKRMSHNFVDIGDGLAIAVKL